VPPRPGDPPLRPPQRSPAAVEQQRAVSGCRGAARALWGYAPAAPPQPQAAAPPRTAPLGRAAGGETACWFSGEGEPCLGGALQALAEPVGHGVFRAGEPPVLGGEVLWGRRGFEGGCVFEVVVDGVPAGRVDDVFEPHPAAGAFGVHALAE